MNVPSSTSASRYQAYDPADDDTPTQAAALTMCRKADDLVTAYICDEPVATANVCKNPKNEVDTFACDDKKMAGLQQGLWDAAKSTVGMVISALLGASVTK